MKKIVFEILKGNKGLFSPKDEFMHESSGDVMLRNTKPKGQYPV